MNYLVPHEKQAEIIRSNKRFNVIRAGRKSGKTKLEIEKIAYKAVASTKRLGIKKEHFDTGRKVLYIAPTQDQARNIVWEALKRRLDGIATFNEQRLQAKVKNEDGDYTTIFVGGWENRENYRGLTDVIYIVFDEVDTLRNFYISWREIFRPMFLDTAGHADFIGTPQKENPNLRRLEKEFCEDSDYGNAFHFTSRDNPHLPVEELEAMKKEYSGDLLTYKQEVLAEYVEDTGALFSYTALVDTFSNTIPAGPEKYLIVDIADDGSDKTIFSFWQGLEEYKQKEFQGNTEQIVEEIRNDAKQENIPYSNIAVDAIGVGAGVASNSLLNGIIGYKGSYAAIKTDVDIVRLPNRRTLDHPLVPKITDYRNLRSQCLFTLADYVNRHKLSSRVEGGAKEEIIEELSSYQDASKGDGKRMAMTKDEVKEVIGRSPDRSDTWQMRMYFEVMDDASEEQDEFTAYAQEKQNNLFRERQINQTLNNTR
jgi:hypothetical protein